jgi:hypothetical protein
MAGVSPGSQTTSWGNGTPQVLVTGDSQIAFQENGVPWSDFAESTSDSGTEPKGSRPAWGPTAHTWDE